MQCQFCEETLEDVNALQLHQVASCPAIEREGDSGSFNNETVEVTFKWLTDRNTNVPAVFLIGSNMDDNMELKKCVGCYQSANVSVLPGKYSGQLVIDNDIVPITEFEITLLSEVVHLIVDHDVEDAGSGLSPLHQEMLDHQLKKDYDFGNTRISNKLYGNLLSEEELIDDPSSMKTITGPPPNHNSDISPDFARVGMLPRDSEADDSFYQSFSTPPAFETIDPDSPPLTPIKVPSSFCNIRDMLDDVSLKECGTLAEEPSLHSFVSDDILKDELEDAIRDTPPGSMKSGGDENLETTLEDEMLCDENGISFDYAGNPMSNYEELSVHDKEKHQDLEIDFVSVDYAGNVVDKNPGPSLSIQNNNGSAQTEEDKKKEEILKELTQKSELIEHYKEMKVHLEAKCESYDNEIDRLKGKCNEVEKASQNRIDDIVKEKNGIINDLKVKVDSYETEMNRMNQELHLVREKLTENENITSELDSKCSMYMSEMKQLSEKCVEAEKQREVYVKNADQTNSYETNVRRLNSEVVKLKEIAENLNEQKVFLEAKCTAYENDVKELLEKCNVLANNNEEKAMLEAKCTGYENDVKELLEKCNVLANNNEEKAMLEAKCTGYENEVKELLEKCNVLATNNDEKVLLEAKCTAYEIEVKELIDKCNTFENTDNQVSESETIKDRTIGDLMVKLESYETEMNRLQQEVRLYTGAIEEYKDVKLALESQCQSYQEHIHDLKEESLKQASEKGFEKTCGELTLKCSELEEAKKKIMEDYKGLEEAKNVYEEEIQAERERYETQIKELTEEKSKLSQNTKHETKHRSNHDNHARMNINKLKSENRILKEKLNMIRNESQLNDLSTSKENISPGYKPPLLPENKSFDPESIRYSHQTPTRSTNRHHHTASSDDYTLPSRYNANKYSLSPEGGHDKTDGFTPSSPCITDNAHASYTSNGIDSIMKRYSSPPVNISNDVKVGRSRVLPNSYSPVYDHDSITPSKLYRSVPRSRSRSMDHLDSSGTEDMSFYKPKSLTTIPFCPTSVKELSVGMKISVNRASGRLSRGTVKWIGTLPRHNGEYVGVELESEAGKHDGNLNGIQYFRCKNDRGIFVKFPKVIMAWK